ncbi:hypothetical protein Micbo1qcDRAFT_156769, partial [Microdochium bolleyi]
MCRGTIACNTSNMLKVAPLNRLRHHAAAILTTAASQGSRQPAPSPAHPCPHLKNVRSNTKQRRIVSALRFPPLRATPRIRNPQHSAWIPISPLP